MITLTHIFCYPFKSAQGIALDASRVEERGLSWDRRWMAVDIGGKFLSQRTHPALAHIACAIEADALRLSAPQMEDLLLPLEFHSIYRRNVIVWNDCMSALEVGREADEWISEYLKETSAIVYFPDDSRRTVDPRYAQKGEHTAFADGFPVLVLSEGSLEDLNRRLDRPLPVNRFRPNLVVGGCAPFAEDTWTAMTIDDVELELVKPCARCTITTIDQETLAQSDEPLRTLSGYRSVNNKILFAQNALVRRTGTIRRGSSVAPAVRA